jgi:hypothetical protein
VESNGGRGEAPVGLCSHGGDCKKSEFGGFTLSGGVVRPGHTGLCMWCTFPRIWDGTWPTPYICSNYS